MICIRTGIEKLPEYCDDCQWYGTRPHPYNGWTNICELMSHCMDDDQPEEWVYDGDGRPKACPLVKVEEDTISRQAALALAKDIVVPTDDVTIYRHRCIDPSEILELPSVHGGRRKMKALTAIGAALVTLAAISADVVRGEKIEEAYMTVVVMGVILMLILAAHRELMAWTAYGALAGLIGLALPPLAKPAEVAAIGFVILLVVMIWTVDKTDKVDSVS